VTATNCPTDVFCVAGSCFNTTYTSDADFARSMSFLEAAREAAVYLDTDNLQVFKGEANRCRDRLLTNCCRSDPAGSGMTNQSMFGVGSRLVFDALMNSGNREFLYQGMQALLMGGGFSGSFTSYGVTVAVNGTALPAGSAVLYSGQSVVVAFDPWSLVIAIVIYIVMAALSCDEEEGKLAMKEGALGCATPLAPTARPASGFWDVASPASRTRRTSAASTRSWHGSSTNRAASRSAKGWGMAQAPDCSGFTIAQLQSLDFARMDLTEFYASIVPNMPNVGAMQGGNCRPREQLLLRRGEMPMNRATRFSAACLVATADALPQPPGPNRFARPSPTPGPCCWRHCRLPMARPTAC
jgi:conjugal transfer mating pair stabilization protein TraN